MYHSKYIEIIKNRLNVKLRYLVDWPLTKVRLFLLINIILQANIDIFEPKYDLRIKK